MSDAKGKLTASQRAAVRSRQRSADIEEALVAAALAVTAPSGVTSLVIESRQGAHLYDRETIALWRMDEENRRLEEPDGGAFSLPPIEGPCPKDRK